MMPITWKVNTRIFSNSLLWMQLALTAVLSSGFVFVLLLGLNLVEEHWEDIPSSFLVWGVLAGSLFACFALVFMLISRGITTEYTVSNTGVQQKTITTYGKWMKWLSYIALIFGGIRGAQAAVSANLARARESINIKWNDISEVVYDPDKNEIHLKNNWRILIQLICLPENFNSVQEIITSNVAENIASQQKQSAAASIIYTLCALVCGGLMLPRLPIHFVGIFTLLLMVFTLFSIWTKSALKNVTALISIIVIMVGLALAYFKGTNNFYSEGFLYALGIQSLFLLFFFLLNLKFLISGKNSKD